MAPNLHLDDGPDFGLLSIRNWDKHYENNQTRKLKEMRWVKVPNRHDSMEYADLLDHPHGPAHLGCWLGALQIASKCAERGTLVRSDGTPHTPRSLARISHIDEEWWIEAIPRLVSIGWLSSQPIVSKGHNSPPLKCASSAFESAPGRHLSGAPSISNSESSSSSEGESEGEVARPKRKHSPQEQTARDLAKALGSSLNPCRRQIAALRTAGWDLDQIRSAFVLAMPGMAPWDWTKAAQSAASGAQGRPGIVTDDELLAATERLKEAGR